MKTDRDHILIITVGCLVCIILIFATKRRPPQPRRIKEIQHGHIVWNGSSSTLDSKINERGAEFIIILTNPRSASTSVAHAIGSHVCATSFNEVYGNSQRYSDGLLPSEHGCIESLQCEFVSGGCNSQKWKNRHNDLLGTYKETRRAWCGRVHIHPQSPWPSCGNTCVVTSKIHGVYFKQHEHEKREQLKQLLAYAGTRVVVVERKNTDKLQCSLRYSRATGVWHGVNKTAYKRWKQRNCRGHEDATFKQDQDEWFTWIHDTMAELHKPYLNMPFKEYVSNPRQSEIGLQTFSGLPKPHAYREACLNGCNCGNT